MQQQKFRMEDPKPSFASQHLTKFGWKEGKGLGKKENGMKNAIKVKLKNNKSGLGHDHGSEFTFHWWDHIFNKAASSIKVSSTEDDKILLEKTDVKVAPSALISNKKPYSRSSFRGQPLLYGTFVQSGTYRPSTGKVKSIERSNIIQSEESGSEDESKFQGGSNNLEKIFMQTGMTGHKAARHGHRLNGKLKRIQKQENDSGYSCVSKAIDCESNKKKKHEDSLLHSNIKEHENCDYINEINESSKNSLSACTGMMKKKKKKDKNID